jgi:hypothetical protein
MSYLNTDAYKVATRFWNLMDRPEEYNNVETAKRWTTIMADCMGESELDPETFKIFLKWCIELNPYSAEYLFLAKDPAETLKKNLPTLLRHFKAYQKRQAAQAARLAGHKMKAEPVRGSYRMTDTNEELGS